MKEVDTPVPDHAFVSCAGRAQVVHRCEVLLVQRRRPADAAMIHHGDPTSTYIRASDKIHSREDYCIAKESHSDS